MGLGGCLGELRREIEAKRIRYDIACKRLLSVKSILARILGCLLEEYRDCPFDEIAARCIEGNPLIGIANAAGRPADTMRVKGMRTEGVDLAAGAVVYDVAFRALVPPREPDGGAGEGDGPDRSGGGESDDGDAHYGSLGHVACYEPGEQPELIVDVEAQDDFYPGYPLTKRALYYCARLLSDQRGTEFSGSRYGDLKKVCSIWICTKPPRKRRGTVTWYGLGERVLPACAPGFDRAQYDLLSVVMVCLGECDTGERSGVPGLVNLLTVLLSRETSREEKLHVLAEYNIEITADIESEVSHMTSTVEDILLDGWNKGLSEGLEKGIEKGRASGLADGLRNLMRFTGWPMEKAMESLGIPESERPSYAALVGER